MMTLVDVDAKDMDIPKYQNLLLVGRKENSNKLLLESETKFEKKLLIRKVFEAEVGVGVLCSNPRIRDLAFQKQEIR
jgi:hypothetical protein